MSIFMDVWCTRRSWRRETYCRTSKDIFLHSRYPSAIWAPSAVQILQFHHRVSSLIHRGWKWHESKPCRCNLRSRRSLWWPGTRNVMDEREWCTMRATFPLTGTESTTLLSDNILQTRSILEREILIFMRIECEIDIRKDFLFIEKKFLMFKWNFLWFLLKEKK